MSPRSAEGPVGDLTVYGPKSQCFSRVLLSITMTMNPGTIPEGLSGTQMDLNSSTVPRLPGN